MKPNIFNIATKELSQDAFITWLLQWADIDNQQHDNLLHTCGQDFVRKLIASQYHDTVSTITKVEAGRQWKNIDVWAEINTPESNYLIIIEDKTFSSEHWSMQINCPLLYSATRETEYPELVPFPF